MKVNFIDLKQRYIEEKTDLLKCLKKTLKSGNLVLTPEIDEFENKICKYVGSKYCVSLNSGTDALMISLWALGIKKGDEVITSPISFVATAGAIAHVGAIPVFVDVDQDSNINPSLIEDKITNKTKAIIPVHWTGRISNMIQINKIAKKYKLHVIEDSAQAMGSYFNKKHGGTFSKIGIFSAHPLKNLNAIGDAGFLVTNDKKIYEKIKIYRNHGLISRDNVEFFGVNSRMDTINAVILGMRLKKLKGIISRRRNNVNLYRKLINTNHVIIPKCKKIEFNSFVMFIVLAEERDRLQKYLAKFNIQTLVYYGTPLHLHKASKIFSYKIGDFPIAESICKKVLALPHHQHLTEKQISFVAKKINDFYLSM